jgi:hypothetical protein
MTDFLVVNGEQIPKSEAFALIRMLMNDAKEIAGVFHGQNRSEKFRANWPDEKAFAECEWRNFMEAARAMYAEALGDPQRSEYDKRRMFLAIALWQQVEATSPETYGGIQMLPGTQQFEGDKFENRKIAENFGKHSNTFKELLLNSSAYH